MSERAKTRLNRSSSQSSNDSPQHIPNGDDRQAADRNQQEQSTEPKPARPHATKQENKPVGPVGSSNFFATLDWSQDAMQNGGTPVTEVTEPVQEIKLPTEAEESLLGNDSDDDDMFSSLRTSDHVTNTDLNSGEMGASGNLLSPKPVHVSKSESNMFDEETKTEVVDFFNMNNDSGVNNKAHNDDLLTLEKDPSNADLLSGTANMNVQDDSKFNDMFASDGNTFDPFQSFAASKQELPSVNVSQTKEQNQFNSFDPFSSSGAKSDSDFFGSGLSSGVQNNEPATGGDLMGSWDSHVTGLNSSPNISRNSSSSNIAGGSGSFQMGGNDIPRNNSGAFQQMGAAGTFQMGGANIPKTGSGTFQPMGGSSNMPRNSSGGFQGTSMMGQTQGPGMKNQGGGKVDPFADFGKKP